MFKNSKSLVTILFVVMLVFAMQSVALADTTLKFFHTLWIPDMVDLMDEAAAKYEEENPGITIQQTRVSWTDAPSQLMTSIVGGEAPDIIIANPPMLAQFRNIGALADITDFVSDDFKESLTPAALELVVNQDGRFDGIPTEGSTWALFYRQDLFEEAGLDPNSPPTTHEEMIEYAKALTKDTDNDGRIDQWGYGWPVQAENASQYWVHFLQMAGSDVIEFKDGKWHSLLDQPEALAGTQFMVDLVQKHKVTPPTVVNMDWEDITNGFTFGRFAMIHNGAWVVGAVKNKAPELEGKWDTALFPAGPEGTIMRGHSNTLHILEASRNKEMAYDFLEFLYREGRGGTLSYGEELAALVGALIPTDGYLEYAADNYEPLLQSFVKAAHHTPAPPLAPYWQSFTELYGNAAVQEMLMGNADVESTLADLHDKLEQMHAR